MTIQAWGTPGSLPDDPTDVEPGNPLTAGDEVGEVVEIVDQHLIPAPPERHTRGNAEVPAWLTDWQMFREEVARLARSGDALLVNCLTQAPRVIALGSWWALRGASRAVTRVSLWLYDGDMHPFYGEVQASDEKLAMRMAQMRERRQKFRWSVLGAFATAAAVGFGVLWAHASWLAPLVILAGAAALARYGRPEQALMLSPSVRKRQVEVLTSYKVAAAFGVLGHRSIDADIKAERTQRWFYSDFVATRGGHYVDLQMPPGVVAQELVQHEQRLAGALVRPEDTVIVIPKPQVTPRDLRLYIFDKPMLSGDMGPGPLGSAKRTNWWEAPAFGRTRIGSIHHEPIAGGAHFYGGRPNYGKSSICLIAAIHAALDPNALLVVFELKGAPVYEALRPVCHRFVSASPENDPGVIDKVRDGLQWVLDECGRRNAFLTDLHRRGETNEKEVNEELSAKYPEFQPITVVFDEAHRMFDKLDNPSADEDAALIGKVMKAVRSVAITVVAATQLAGAESVPVVVTRAARVRGCLSVLEHVSFQQIFGNLGKDAFANSGVSRFEQGTVLLRSESGAPVKVKTFHMTPAVVAAVGKRALEMRQRLHALTGEAAGQSFEAAEREDPAVLLRDVLANIEQAAPNRGTAADRRTAWLHALEPMLDQDRAPGWLALELDQRHVEVKRVNRKGAHYDNGQLTAPGVDEVALKRALRVLDEASSDA